MHFYAGVAPDDSGGYLRDIHIWPNERLERAHDCLQWLFPVWERSAFNMTAPALDDAQSRNFWLGRSCARSCTPRLCGCCCFTGSR